MIQSTTLGKTGLQVSRLGIGMAEFLRLDLQEVEGVRRVLNTSLDNGVNFIDTAACYGTTEELIGRAIPERRHEYILATKAGHALNYEAGKVVGRNDGEAWTGNTVRASIDNSLKRLRTDYIDLLHLHSPSDVAMLENGEVIDALLEAQREGKVRFIGFSGDNEPAMWAVNSGVFDTLMTSLNLLDQKGLQQLLPLAREKSMGIIIKRPLANGVGGAKECTSTYATTLEYFRRWQVMDALGPIPGVPENLILLAMGFTMDHTDVDIAIVGLTEPEYILEDIELLEQHLPISKDVVEELHRRFAKVGRDWPQMS